MKSIVWDNYAQVGGINMTEFTFNFISFFINAFFIMSKSILLLAIAFVLVFGAISVVSIIRNKNK